MSRQSHNPSMHDVAKEAGVSHQTVSRVLNGFPSIRPETRQRVLDAIEKLGYRRNLAARSLATGRSQAIGVLAPDSSNYGPTQTLYAVVQAIQAAGYNPLVTTTDESPEMVELALEFLIGRSVEALVVMAPVAPVLEVVDATHLDVPTAYLLTGDERAPWSAAVDQAGGVRQAMEHLLALGHRHIQHLRGPEDSTEGRMRVEAFEAFVAAKRLPKHPMLMGDWTADRGYSAHAELDPEVTAVFCGNDQMAIGLIHAVVDSGGTVPEALSIVGFDDIPVAKHSIPPLTTVGQDFHEVGVRAVEKLLVALDGGRPETEPPIPARFEVRSSTSAVREPKVS